MSDPIAIAWAQQVARCEELELPRFVRQGVLSRPEESGRLLHELMSDPAVWHTTAALHVVSLLGELRYEPAVHDLVDLLWDDPELEGVHEALLGFGSKAVPFLLLNVDRFPEQVLPTLVAIGRDDPAVLPRLVDALELLDDGDAANRDAIVALVDAIEELGGERGALREKSHNVRAANAMRLARLAMEADNPGKKRRR